MDLHGGDPQQGAFSRKHACGGLLCGSVGGQGVAVLAHQDSNAMHALLHFGFLASHCTVPGRVVPGMSCEWGRLMAGLFFLKDWRDALDATRAR